MFAEPETARCIPVFEPAIGDAEAANVLAAIEEGAISGTGGRFIEEFERRFAEWCGARCGVAVSSGSTGLHLALAVLGVGPGHEVLVSALTNIATANAAAQLGAVVVPVDADPDTWCMDTRQLEGLVNESTAAILPVHLYGHPVNMAQVAEVAAKCSLVVVEDAAEAHGAEVIGNRVGALSDVGVFSFYANKVITTGEGGMLLMDDPALADRARLLRNLAFTTPRFWHEEIGFNYRMTNLQAAIGCGQMDRIDWVIAEKRRLARRYIERLRDVPGLRLPVERPWAKSVYWMFGLVVEEWFPLTRDQLAARLRERGIDTRTFFCPMNLQPALLNAGLVRTDVRCPVAEDLWRRGMYLPSSPQLTDDDLDRICSVIAEAAR